MFLCYLKQVELQILFFLKGQKNIGVKYIIAPSEEWVYNDEIAEKKIFFLRILRNKYFYSSTFYLRI